MLLLCVAAPHASGQTASLPNAVITSVSLSSSDRNAIRTFLDARVAELESGDPADFIRAAAALNEPLAKSLPDGQTRSFSFRREYEQQLSRHLDALLNSADRSRTFLGMRLCGNLATDNASERLTDMLSTDHDAPTRLFAAAMLRNTFEIVSRSTLTPPVTEARMLAAVDAIAESAMGESDILILDAHARSLIAAGEMIAEDVEAVGPHAYEMLAKVIQTQAQTVAHSPASLDELTPVVRSLEALQGVMLQVDYPYTEAMLVQSMGLAADVMAYLIGRQNAGLEPLTEPGGNSIVGQRKALDVVMMSYAENISVFARGHMARLKNAPPPDQNLTNLAVALERALVSTDDGERRRLLGELQNTYITVVVAEVTEAPYGFDDNRFVSRLDN
jgi:hypothetical protein